MKNKYCQECGGEIIFLYETPARGYRIEDGELKRDDNNLSDDSQLNPYCSNDKEHSIAPTNSEEENEFWQWSDGVFMHFIDRGIYEL